MLVAPLRIEFRARIGGLVTVATAKFCIEFTDQVFGAHLEAAV
jgi:hypothetical protein